MAAYSHCIIVTIVIVFQLSGTGETDFLYGYGDFDANNELGNIAINEKFGRTNILAKSPRVRKRSNADR